MPSSLPGDFSPMLSSSSHVESSSSPRDVSPMLSSSSVESSSSPRDVNSLLSMGSVGSDIVTGRDIQRLAKFSCEMCGKFLTCKSAYDRHMTSHTGVKAFVCPSCGQGFTRKENLRLHRFTKQHWSHLSLVTRKPVFRFPTWGKTQTGLLSYKDPLESWNCGFSKYRYYAIEVANIKRADQTAQMVRLICTYFVRIWLNRFSHGVAHLMQYCVFIVSVR